LTKKSKINVAGDSIEVEEYVDSDDKDDPDVVNNGTKEFANRHSFIVMKDQMQKNVSGEERRSGPVKVKSWLVQVKAKFTVFGLSEDLTLFFLQGQLLVATQLDNFCLRGNVGLHVHIRMLELGTERS